MDLDVKPSPARGAENPQQHGALYLLDGHALTFRAYYSMGINLTAPDGSPVGAVFGFLRMLLRILNDHNPEYFAVVFDTAGPTFRSEISEDYKATREAPPPTFSDQMEHILALLRDMGIRVYQQPGYEADDIIATVAGRRSARAQDTVVISADKDLFQLVDDHTTLLRIGSFGASDLKPYDPAAVEERLGVRPDQVPDWLALVGDTSDNIPGVPSIGEKGATALLQEFGSVDALLGRLDDIKSKRARNALAENADRARVSLQLATVHRDVPVDWNLEECRVPDSIWNDETQARLLQLGFTSILKEQGLQASPEALAGAQSDRTPTEYRTILSETELRDWVAAAARAPWLALDTETTDIDPMRADLVGISLSCAAGKAVYIPVAHRVGRDADSQIPVAALREILAPLFSPADPVAAPRLSAHHAKYDWKILERAGFDLAPPAFDSMLASFLLDPGRNGGHGLKALSSAVCGVMMQPLTDIIGSGKNAVTVDETPIEAIYEYACRDADITLRLTEIFQKELQAVPALDRLMREVEVPLIPILQKMETGGVAVDGAHLARLSEKMSHEIERLTREVWEAAGSQFNIDSPKQTAEVLFEKLGLPSGKKTKSGYSTDSTVLEALARDHPVARLILEYREIKKLKSTYADSLPQEIHPGTGRVHTSYNQTIAQTGRLSSTNPNLQNIPVRTELGREIRRSFIPDAPDHRFLAADYSQIELRILAHLSGDAALRRAYQEDRDVHALTAARVFGVAEADVTSEMRGKAKMINFGIIYGISAHGLSQRLGIARGEAAELIDAYFKNYPAVREWIDALLEKARESGYVETMLGRRRLLPDLTAKNGSIRANAERIAINTPIQGTSADMIKLAMIRVARGLGEAAPGARMVLQIHDELIFSVPESELEAATPFVTESMRDALPLDVPIVVDVSTASNWAECA
jgi:DNA polymerase I